MSSVPPDRSGNENRRYELDNEIRGEGSGSDLAELLRNSGSGKATGEAWPAEQKEKWKRRPRTYRRFP